MTDRFEIREIENKIRRVLMSEWDPIGVSDCPDANDEYDSYIGGIYGLIQRCASRDEIVSHLRNLEVEQMECSVGDTKRYVVADSLLQLFSK